MKITSIRYQISRIMKDIDFCVYVLPKCTSEVYFTATRCLLTVPYLACHAKKYSSAASGCPISVKDTQKIQFPMTRPLRPCIFSNGAVIAISGS